MNSKTNKKSYLNFVNELSQSKPLICLIRIKDKIGDIIIVDIGLSSLADIVFYGVMHHWTYWISLNTEESLYGKCTGGACYGKEDAMMNIVEKFPKVIDFIINNYDDIVCDQSPHYQCYILNDGDVVKNMETT